jgi:uncharacterized membrane protein
MRQTLDAIALAALAVLFWITFCAFYGPGRLPARIPVHFDLAGRPDGWGTPAMLLLFPAVAFALYLLITLVARFPSAFNFPVRVTAENRPRLEAMAVQMVAFLKTELVCLFAWIQWCILASARNGQNSLSPALLPISLVAVFATIGWHFAAMRRAARPQSGS